MKVRVLLLASALLILASLALLVAGLQAETGWLWQAGLGTLALAMLLSLATRWARRREKEGS